jgi:hypothetical protein
MSSLSKIKKSFEDLQQLPFPKATKNRDLVDWISELAEMDGFYAGLATTLLLNKPIKIKKFPEFETLFKGLEKLQGQRGISEVRYREYENYLMTLEHLAKDIQDFNKKTGGGKTHSNQV